MWVDASNYTGPLTDQGCADLKAAGAVGVIIQAVTGNDGKSYTRQQLETCVRNGLRLQGYVFPGSLASKLAMFDGYALQALWLDLELPISVAAVNGALRTCDDYLNGSYIAGLTGIYSGRWFFINQGWANKSYWSDRPLWDSNYDGDAVTQADFRPYGGWESCVVKQYKGTSSIGHVHEIDLDVTGS